jgi:hypothetical protein
MAQGRLNAALDLIQRLARVPLTAEIHVLAADPSDADSLEATGARRISSSGAPFHFGQVLLNEVSRRSWSQFAYFGGASAPLLTEERLEGVFSRLLNTSGAIGWVNNYHSTDWAAIRVANGLFDLAERLPSDNPLGWVLANEAGYEIKAMPPEAATRLDLDTPADILLLHRHPHLGPHLAEFINAAPPDMLAKVAGVVEVMRTPASALTIIGRSAAAVWRRLEERTQIWVRMFAEERGMVASRRLARGEVRSLVARLIEEIGPKGFIHELCEVSDAVLWDTRVWMAHRGGWPCPGDRFAADLGWVDDIGDHALRRLCGAIGGAPRPIVAGGHGVVSGGVHALLDKLEGSNLPAR